MWSTKQEIIVLSSLVWKLETVSLFQKIKICPRVFSFNIATEVLLEMWNVISQNTLILGFPKGVFNVITSSRSATPDVGKFLCHSSEVAALSFTGN